MSDVLGFNLPFSSTDLSAALMISFLSALGLVGLFFFLDRYTERRYFGFWTVAWIFYALWLALRVGVLDDPTSRWFQLVREWCVGAAAVFLLWGSAWFLNRRTRPTPLVLLLAFLLLLSGLVAYGFESARLVQIPLFGWIGLVSQVTAACFYRLRRETNFRGAGLLAAGFSLWGIHLAASPFLQSSANLINASFFMAALLQLFIALSMILVLEEARHSHRVAFRTIRSHKSKADLLQEKIVSTEERYRSLFDQASEGIVITDAEDLRILELNQAAKRLLGINNGEVSQSALPSFCQLHSNRQPAPRTGTEWFAAICRQRNLNLVRRDGGVTPTEVDGAPIGFEGRPAYQFFLRELTERTRLEQQLRQAEKLSALGQMISGVAHELNNPLAVIRGYLELILARDKLTEQTRADLGKVARESDRAAKLVNNFLTFAREQPLHREPVQLNDSIRRVVDLRKFDLQNAGVELRLDLDAQLPSTQADPDQLQQVLVNLVSNALDVLTTEARPGLLRISTRRNGNLIVVTVEDDGPGVPPDVLPYIFEPFFTTKEVGKGTGLGLSIAHGVLADHNGRIFHQPATIGGAAFVFELPIVAGSIDSETRPLMALPSPVAASPECGRAKILILDDERSIAELLGEVLDMIGYSTVNCQSGAEALALIDQRDFDLIISDFRMPNMNGQEFYQAAVSKKPDLARRIVFVTGDVVNEDTQNFLRSTGNPHLTKPFQLVRVEQIVREVLDRQSTVRPGS